MLPNIPQSSCTSNIYVPYILSSVYENSLLPMSFINWMGMERYLVFVCIFLISSVNLIVFLYFSDSTIVLIFTLFQGLTNFFCKGSDGEIWFLMQLLDQFCLCNVCHCSAKAAKDNTRIWLCSNKTLFEFITFSCVNEIVFFYCFCNYLRKSKINFVKNWKCKIFRSCAIQETSGGPDLTCRL